MKHLLRASLVLCTLAWAGGAQAMPMFAKKYGMACSACHVAWPVLNQQGMVFRDSGYQLGLVKDDPVTAPSTYVPFAGRTVPAYSMTRVTNQPSANGPVETRTGGIPTPGFDLLAAGTFAPDLSYLVVLAGFVAAEPGAVESAWARIGNIGGTRWLNLKAGKFEPEQPVSERRGIFRTGGHAIYAARSQASQVGFSMAANHVGIELDGHDTRSLTRYSVALLSASGDPGSSNLWSSPVVYAHATRAFELENTVLPWLRLGVLGAQGWWPTRFAPDAGGADLPGTGKDHKGYTRYGGEISGIFGYPSTPLYWTAAVIHGTENAALSTAGPAGEPASGEFTGGFLEVNWVPFAEVASNATPWVIIARYDQVRYRRGPGDLDAARLGFRRHLALGPRASLAIHGEVLAQKVKGVGANPDKGVETQTALLGLDLCF